LCNPNHKALSKLRVGLISWPCLHRTPR
jgi:hypothetical protein